MKKFSLIFSVLLLGAGMVSLSGCGSNNGSAQNGLSCANSSYSLTSVSGSTECCVNGNAALGCTSAIGAGSSVASASCQAGYSLINVGAPYNEPGCCLTTYITLVQANPSVAGQVGCVSPTATIPVTGCIPGAPGC